MANIVSNDRVRVALLYAMLLLVFAAAWVSDRWPNLALVAIVLAVAVVASGTVLLYVLAKRVSSKLIFSELPPEAPDEPVVVDLSSPARLRKILPTRKRLNPRRGTFDASLVYYTPVTFDQPLVYFTPGWPLRLQGSRPSRRISSFAARDWGQRVLASEGFRPLTRTSELDDWRVAPFGRDEFRVSAGAFEIEHVGGHTKIRVLDATRVTVEDDARHEDEETSNLGPGQIQHGITTYQ